MAQISAADGTANTLMFTQRYQLCDGTPTAWLVFYSRAPIFDLSIAKTLGFLIFCSR